MPRKYCLFGIVCIGLLFSDIGMTQSRNINKIATATKESNLRSSQQPWFPYMSICPSYQGIFFIGDTIITQLPPDSVELFITTSCGDSEKIWLGGKGYQDWRPGIVYYRGSIVVIESNSPILLDGILQLNNIEPGYKKIAYRSFNDQRLYSYRMEWSRIVFPEDKK